ncbi:hypothetical protein [Sporosarcina sp. FSL K6-1508]|uniref:hypothetical protein n=1 Tax=Sporosarcina sp. FSL K6-1508 TaxID=2921553 RepID=UPI0030F8F208
MMTEKVKLGALSIEGKVLPFPQRPWGYEGTHAPEPGDIHRYRNGGSIGIVDSTDPAALISWVPGLSEEGKRVLVADRNILTDITWDQLNEQGLVFGREVKLGGNRFKLRILTGGDRPFEGDYELGGTPSNNEWDQIIVNLEENTSLPIPTEEDFSEYVSAESFNGNHNKFWNWAYTLSWCQEKFFEAGSYRVSRGYNSARSFHSTTASYRYVYIGWRPVLEVLDSETLDSGNQAEDGLKNLSDFELEALIESANEELIDRRVKGKVSKLVDSLLNVAEGSE